MLQFGPTGQDPFFSGKLGMVIQNEGLHGTLTQAGSKVNFEWGVFKLPTLNSSIETANWSSSYSLELYDNANRSNTNANKSSQRNRGAWEFLKYLNGSTVQEFFAAEGFMIANKTYHEAFINSDPVKKAIAESIPYTREAEFFRAVPKWNSEIQIYVNNLYASPLKHTVGQTLQDCQKLLQDMIDKFYAVG